ncbi:DUF4974 domain-containing protein [Chitinophaga agrisoli]|uniref:DUF4974 domain-containing protein n=1 Tax=Chitinophaga agrisoli TaxID=2607653 RepID=A0A5B2VV12_9BACT|nr:FecR domain-containing protein [Chitinophaga agrisoli]KAA2243081.1 DUF4974 domain-containing protein [Chitinophaga agrisoli]
MMHEDLFVTLITRKLAGEASAQELQELETLLQANPELRERAVILQKYYTESHHHVTANTEQALQRTLQRLQQPQQETSEAPASKPRTALRRSLYAVATVAAAVLAFVIITRVMKQPRPAAPLAAAVKTDTASWLNRQNGKATKAIIELTDGSKIWLNADSRLTYPEVFSSAAAQREVYLEGEAFFDVATDAARPFIIHLRKGTIKVLGTSFNIRAYENEPVQTSVTTGKVAFIPRYTDNRQQQDTILIMPDVKVSYTQSTGQLVKETTAAEDDKAWTEGRLIFKNASLESIAAELERSFGKKVAFKTDAPRHYRLTGSFQHNSLQDIMYYLARSRAFRYEITDSTLLISE